MSDKKYSISGKLLEFQVYLTHMLMTFAMTVVCEPNMLHNDIYNYINDLKMRVLHRNNKRVMIVNGKLAHY